MKRSSSKLLRQLALRLMPDCLLWPLKRYHYIREVRRFSSAEGCVFRWFLGPGDVAVDLGANVGWYTRVLSDLVGGAGRVYAVEPVPPTFELLSSCVRRLALSNVVLINCAASAEEGSAVMSVPVSDTGGENFYRAAIEAEYVQNKLRRFRVPLRTVDSMVSADERVTLIKCDVEGHEGPAIAGALGVIDRDRPVLFVEVSGDPDAVGSPARELFAALRQYGYEAYWLDGSRLRRRVLGDRSVNYFFLTPSHMARAGERVL